MIDEAKQGDDDDKLDERQAPWLKSLVNEKIDDLMLFCSRDSDHGMEALNGAID